jgi:hypothetical protein
MWSFFSECWCQITNSKEQSHSWELSSYKLNKKLATLYGTWRLITMFTRVCHWSIFWAWWIQFTLQHIFYKLILILSSHLCLVLSNFKNMTLLLTSTVHGNSCMFMVYLMMLSIAQTIQTRNTGWFINWKGYTKKKSWQYHSTFSWIDQGNPWKISVRIVGLLAEIWTHDFPDMKEWLQCLVVSF